MKEGNIFLDLDNSMFNTTPIFMNYLNKRYGIESKLEDYVNNASFEIILKKYLPIGTCPSAEDIYRDFVRNLLTSIDEHESVSPFEDMVETIFLLASKYTIWIVTARNKEGLHVIEHITNKHIPGCVTGNHCVWGYEGGGKNIAIPKKDFIWRVEGRKVAFLDDTVKEILEMQDLVPSYLFDPTGVNNHIQGIHHRVRSWKEFGKLFL
jgi:hypothetical protein